MGSSLGVGVSEYEEVIEAAEKEAANGLYKEAYNTLGRALNIGGPADRECRYRRGVYALQVGQSRLDQFQAEPEQNRTLMKAGCWLSRSEAYLMSAREGAPERELTQIADDLAAAKQEQERFRRLCRASSLDQCPNGDGSEPDE